MKVKFKKLNPIAESPVRGSAAAAGYDLTVTSCRWNSDTQIMEYGTGIAVEIPAGHFGLVCSRSSVCNTGLILSNGSGIIDSDYRGEIKAKFYRHEIGETYDIGERFLQLIILPLPDIEFEETDQLSTSVRGEGGYGSTGK